ncbi:MAG: fructosamine kinase family protein [Anaerolineales bacterium]
MMIPEAVQDWLEENGYGGVASTRPASGGCIHQGVHVTTRKGDCFFLKVNPSAPPEMFACEVEGLQVLGLVPNGPRVPQVFLCGEGYLLLEDLRSSQNLRADFWASLGRVLACLHQFTAPKFGFVRDNFIGYTPQPNPWTEDGYHFFAEYRLGFQARLAHQRGLIAAEEMRTIERIARRLPELIPPQPASLIHGDLWRGNVIADSSGGPALIDPAAHYGWAEAELAMMALFGGFHPNCYAAYAELRPYPPGLEERIPIYNLYHLLNHTNMFGAGYLTQVRTILKRFS